jgi:hypothetical protein
MHPGLIQNFIVDIKYLCGWYIFYKEVCTDRCVLWTKRNCCEVRDSIVKSEECGGCAEVSESVSEVRRVVRVVHEPSGRESGGKY